MPLLTASVRWWQVTPKSGSQAPPTPSEGTHGPNESCLQLQIRFRAVIDLDGLALLHGGHPALQLAGYIAPLTPDFVA